VPIHLLLVHFPLALLCAGTVLDVAGAVTRSDPARRGAGVLLILGSVFALLAFLTGQGAVAPVLARLHPGDPRLEIHAQWGAVGSWVVAAGGALRALWWNRLGGAHGLLTLAVAAASAVLIIFVSLSGLAISHGSSP